MVDEDKKIYDLEFKHKKMNEDGWYYLGMFQATIIILLSIILCKVW